MIWGEVIQEIRRFHLALVEQSPTLLKAHSPELALDGTAVPFPAATGDMDDWNPDHLPGSIAEWVEFHPVERVLLEGPLLPIEKVNFPTDQEFTMFANSIVELEKNWMRRIGPGAANIPSNWEQELRSRLLRLQTRAGLRRLRQA
ncbi:MAG: hypothetical protein JST80_03155 [Bdellovibrionales bacterium]|nr:hypothetical protein [Bdellovibrionales bacterium]